MLLYKFSSVWDQGNPVKGLKLLQFYTFCMGKQLCASGTEKNIHLLKGIKKKMMLHINPANMTFVMCLCTETTKKNISCCFIYIKLMGHILPDAKPFMGKQ